MTYQRLKELIENYDIYALEKKVSRNLPKAHSDGSYHEVPDHYKTKEHHLDVFNVQVEEFRSDNDFEEATIYFKWKYCPLCKQVRNKSIIGYYEEENIAYERELINKGEVVS